MPNKLTIEEVKKRAKDIGTWEVLDNVYINAHIKLKCKCTKCGYIHSVTGNDIQQGKGCPCCYTKNKLTIEEVKRRAAAIGIWEILDDVYVGSHSKLNCRCIKNGHLHKVTPNRITKGVGCFSCQHEAMRFTIEEVKKKAKELGKWIVLDDVYKGNFKRLKCECTKCGYIHKISWARIQREQGCPKCYGNMKLTIEEIKDRSLKLGTWKILDTVYKGTHYKLNCKCIKCGYKHRITWSNIQQKSGCPKCSSGAFTTDFVRLEVVKRGYVLIGEYKNAKTKIHLICPQDHDYFTTWGNFMYNNSECSKCSKNGFSVWESNIKKLLDNWGCSYIGNDKTQLVNPNTNYKLELDIWMPQLNKAIECNGTYWHSKKRAIQNDKIKKQLCKQQSINLLVITEKEWNENTDKCKVKIKNFVTGE